MVWCGGRVERCRAAQGGGGAGVQADWEMQVLWTGPILPCFVIILTRTTSGLHAPGLAPAEIHPCLKPKSTIQSTASASVTSAHMTHPLNPPSLSHTHTRMCVSVYSYTYTHTLSHTHTPTHTHTHTYMPPAARSVLFNPTSAHADFLFCDAWQQEVAEQVVALAQAPEETAHTHVQRR